MADDTETTLENQTELSDTPPGNPSSEPPPAAAPSTPPEADPVAEMKAQMAEMSKALTRNQQELAHLKRAKEQQDGELTAEQELKRQRALEEGRKLRAKLEQYVQDAGDQDGIDVQLAKSVTQMRQELDALKEENQSLRQQVTTRPAAPEPTVEEQWANWQRKYPGADVKGIWKDAVKAADKSFAVKNAEARLNAGKIDQETFDEIRQGAASDIFHREADQKKAPTASAPPPPPPSGKRTVPMRGGQNPAPPQESDPFMDLVRRESERIDKDDGLTV